MTVGSHKYLVHTIHMVGRHTLPILYTIFVNNLHRMFATLHLCNADKISRLRLLVHSPKERAQKGRMYANVFLACAFIFIYLRTMTGFQRLTCCE